MNCSTWKCSFVVLVTLCLSISLVKADYGLQDLREAVIQELIYELANSPELQGNLVCSRCLFFGRLHAYFNHIVAHYCSLLFQYIMMFNCRRFKGNVAPQVINKMYVIPRTLS